MTPGRLKSKRQSSQKLCFFDIESFDASQQIQLVASAKRYEESSGVHPKRLSFEAVTKAAHPGDVVCNL